MGASRRAHHARVQAERDAAAEAARMEQMMRQQQESMAKLVEAAKPPPPPPEVETPTPVASTLASAKEVGTTGGIRTAASKRKTIRKTGSGAAALRIPLNVGGTASTAGLNIG